MKHTSVPVLALGVVRIISSQELRRSGVVRLSIADAVLRVRSQSRVLKYFKPNTRYAIAYHEDGPTHTITPIKENPTMMQFFRLQERSSQGSLPTKEVWKKLKPKKRPY